MTSLQGIIRSLRHRANDKQKYIILLFRGVVDRHWPVSMSSLSAVTADERENMLVEGSGWHESWMQLLYMYLGL